MKNQHHMPLVEALITYTKEHKVPFYTPGHKNGHGAPELLKAWMGKALPYDVGLMYALDDYHEPEGAIKEAQDLAADLYGSREAWFSINGTTGAIQTMIMATLSEGDTVIIPREAHGSVTRALLLSGAKPVYLEGRFNDTWGIPLGTTPEEVKEVILAHPEAKALILVSPNYYGVGIDMKAIVDMAHEHGLIVMVDEAHGPHVYFHEDLPMGAITAGADLVAQSTHKLLGSLTQTSMLHVQGDRVDYHRIRQMHQILMSTSPNYIFLASLDMARHQAATEGQALMSRTLELARRLRSELNRIPGIRSPYLADMEGAFSLDETKVIIDVAGLGLNGIDAEKEIRELGIEVELVKGHHMLVLITLGDSESSIQAVIDACTTLSEAHYGKVQASSTAYAMASVEEHLPTPEVVLTPREAWQRDKEEIPFCASLGRIAGETISYYPPGIPFVAMGERITQSVIDYVGAHQAAGYVPNGAHDRTLETIVVCKEK